MKRAILLLGILITFLGWGRAGRVQAVLICSPDNINYSYKSYTCESGSTYFCKETPHANSGACLEVSGSCQYQKFSDGSCTPTATGCTITNPALGWSACGITCDPDIWSGWSACTVSCGGGTQSRTNQCGTIETRTCNTEACCSATNPTAVSLVSPSSGTNPTGSATHLFRRKNARGYVFHPFTGKILSI